MMVSHWLSSMASHWLRLFLDKEKIFLPFAVVVELTSSCWKMQGSLSLLKYSSDVQFVGHENSVCREC